MSTTREPDLEMSPSRADASKQRRPVRKRQPKQKSRAERLGRSALMLVRRVHLYSGIFMFPFVLLYGFTGWFFNHPRLFTGDDVRTFAASDISSEALAGLPTATETARAVVDEMNLQSFMIDGPEIELTRDRTPRFNGFLSYSVSADDATHQVTINPVTRNGEVRTKLTETSKEPSSRKPNPLAEISHIELPNDSFTQVQSDVSVILKDLGLQSGEAKTGRRSATIVFSAIADGVPCIVTYSLADGAITSVRDDERPTIQTKSFLQRLHLSRSYSPGFDTRWVWALLVDAMFMSMVFWGVSGLMMWWQVKRTRLVGGGVLLASVLFAGAMAFNMHDSLTTGEGRGGAGRAGERGPSQRSVGENGVNGNANQR